MNGLRAQLGARAAALPEGDPLIATLKTASGEVDSLRKKIVATKEGGAITGEERLREYLMGLYGSVNGYEGRPTQMQLDRTVAIAHEMADVQKSYDAWTAKNLPAINSALTAKKLDAIVMKAP
jgi:hypothetical protein